MPNVEARLGQAAAPVAQALPAPIAVHTTPNVSSWFLFRLLLEAGTDGSLAGLRMKLSLYDFRT